MKHYIIFRFEDVLVNKYDVEKAFCNKMKKIEQLKELAKQGDAKELISLTDEINKMNCSKEDVISKMSREYLNKTFEKKSLSKEINEMFKDLERIKKVKTNLEIVIVSEFRKSNVSNLLINNGVHFDEVVGKCDSENLADVICKTEKELDDVVVFTNNEEDLLKCEDMEVKCVMCDWGSQKHGNGIKKISEIWGEIGLKIKKTA